MNIEMYFNANNKIFRFPILPADIEREINANYDREVVQGLGEIAIYNNNALSEMSIEAFFPKQNYPYAEYSNYPSPAECIAYFKDLKNKGLKGRFILTGGHENINQEMKIEGFSYKPASIKGISYTLKLVEHREIILPTYLPKNTSQTVANDTRPNTTTTTQTAKTHTVAKGDSLYKIAKKYYGKGEDYPKLVEKNKTKYPSLVKNPSYIVDGWVLNI